MDFRPGGHWLYFMKGPDGNGMYSMVEFSAIVPKKSYTADVAFCDEAGNKNMAFPVVNWHNEFSDAGGFTRVNVRMTFTKEADMQALIAMGFEEGFKMGLGNLDEYLQAMLVSAQQRQQRQQLNPPPTATGGFSLLA